MGTDLPKVCVSVLKKIYGEELDKFRITVQGRGCESEGFTNEMIYLQLDNSVDKIDLAVKIMADFKIPMLQETIERSYDSEIKFYETVWPAFDKFQKSHAPKRLFDKLPLYYGFLSQDGSKVLVMENLKTSGFALKPKGDILDRKLVKVVFENFGHFHALSFGLKEQNRSQFDTFSEIFAETWERFKNAGMIEGMLTNIVRLVASQLQADEEVIDKVKQVVENVNKIFKEAVSYKGGNDVILHGDCWINNFLFKHNESGQIDDLRFLDFQQMHAGTPVYDLASWFYSSATKELFDDLEYFLQVYHGSLSNHLRQFGCDVNSVYPYQTLKDEWKQYSKFGMFVGLMMWRHQTNEAQPDYKNMDGIEGMVGSMKCDEEKYAKASGDLIVHMCKNNFI